MLNNVILKILTTLFDKEKYTAAGSTTQNIKLRIGVSKPEKNEYYKSKREVGKKSDTIIYYSNTLSDHGVALRRE